MTTSKFRAVKGVLPKKIEIVDWSTDKIHSLLIYASLALRDREYRGKIDKTFVLDEQFRETVKQYDNAYFEEFSARLDILNVSSLGAVGRLSNMVRTVLSYVKSNPHVVTESIEAMLKTTKRFSWALNNFKSETTKIGAEIVSVDNEETTQLDRRNADQRQTNLTLPEIQFNQSLLYLSSLLQSMLKGIKKKDLESLDAKDRLRLAIPMIATMSKALNVKKPQSLIFKKLTINTSNKDDLEKAILEYGQAQE